jgi:hypothetical protein
MKNNLFKKIFTITICIALCLALTACEKTIVDDEEEPIIERPPIFLIYGEDGEDDVVVNEHGQVVMQAETIHLMYNYINYGSTYDTPYAYIVVYEEEMLDSYNEYGYREKAIYSTAYDIEGNLIAPRAVRSYQYGFGDYIVYGDYLIPFSFNYNKVFLLNTVTGEEFELEGINSVDYGNDIVVCYSEGEVAYIMDFEANIIKTFEEDTHFTSVEKYGDYYVTRKAYGSNGYSVTLWDAQFNQISRPYSSNINYTDGYFICSDSRNEDVDIYDTFTGEFTTLHTQNWITYYNGEIYISQTPNVGSCTMHRVEDNSIILSSNYIMDRIAKRNGEVTGFLCRVDDMLYVIDTSGTEISSVQVSNMANNDAVSISFNKLITVTTGINKIFFDGNLNMIDTEDRHYQRAESFNVQGSVYIIAYIAYPYNCDILDAEGNIILEDLDYVGYSGYSDYLYVKVDGISGIMRLDGTWVYPVPEQENT